MTVGSTAGAKTTLDPGQAVVLQLWPTRGRLEAQVDWRQEISGGVCYHYGRRCDGHYLYYAPLSRLYSADELRQTQSETLKVDVYSHADVRQVDAPPASNSPGAWTSFCRFSSASPRTW